MLSVGSRQWQQKRRHLLVHLDGREGEMARQVVGSRRHVPKDPHRARTLQELPLVPKSFLLPALQCQFCAQSFKEKRICVTHEKTCPQMPYEDWLSRVRSLQSEATTRDHLCPYCETPFWTAKAKGHSVVCRIRRDSARLPRRSAARGSNAPGSTA
eukprot:3019839-Amphidinium_carterae.2